MDPDSSGDEYPRRSIAAARRMQAARKHRRSPWHYFATFGVLGWLFAVPVVLLTLLGHAVALRLHTRLPTAAGLGAGVLLGAGLVWHRLRQALADDREEES